MKRVLLVMIQPPGCSGVQALIYNKLLPFLGDTDWEFHFAGPAPWLVSRLTERLDYPRERLHYTTNISRSLCCSVRKNRHRKKSVPYFYYGFLQLLWRGIERITGHDSDAYLLRGIEETVRQAEGQWHFDLIAGKSPEFKVLKTVSEVTRAMNKPFLAMVVDPHGARDETGFYPSEPDLQRQIIDQSCGAMFMSPLTMERYIEAGLVSNDKAHYFTDSYPEIDALYTSRRSPLARALPAGSPQGRPLQLIYLGMLPEWRPIEQFLAAFSLFAEQQDRLEPAIELSVFGFVYPRAQQQIEADPLLSRMIRIQPMVSYSESHWLAEDADLQLVVIGPRHLDNYPSKFFEYLAHKKPVLVLGPLQNPLRKIVHDLGIGLYVDSTDTQAILEALKDIQANYGSYKQAYQLNATAIETYSAHRVAAHLCQVLDQCMRESQRVRSL
jgi:glycosyltransferase involved in cell wall biosynthesis